MAITKHICGRLKKLGLNVLPTNSMWGLVHTKSKLCLNVNGISDLFPGPILVLRVMCIIAGSVS